MKSSQYRKIRKMVWEKATYINDASKYAVNQNKLKKNVEQLCKQSDVSNYMGCSDVTKKKVWNHLWTKIRYAGIKASMASKEISDISSIFDRYDDFVKTEWDITIVWDKEKRKHILVSGGKSVHDFLNREGDFNGKQTVGNLVKLKKTVYIARQYSEFVKKQHPISFITSKFDVDDVWGIHGHLQDIGYTSDLTALHLMMDLGFKVIKPDVVISRLFLSLGWLHDIIPNLPQDIEPSDLVGKGKYKSKYQYTKPLIYKPIIALATEIVENTNNKNLVDDIGWVAGTPIREFDIFMVKFGQEPEEQWGLTKNLAKELTIASIRTAKSAAGYAER